jgi:anti-sigma factor RsiW
MNCNHARESLALYAGGDLPAAETEATIAHLNQCGNCRRFYEGLTNNQALLRSFHREKVAASTLATMHQELLSRLEKAEAQLGWWIRLERFFLFEMRRPRFAIAGVALAIVISATVLAQLRHVTANSADTTILTAGSMMRLPAGYQNWTVVGSVSDSSSHWKAGLSQKVYMSPDAYREYKRTGKFPDGTVMVLESASVSDQQNPVALEASVKDKRFSEGWGYFRFVSAAGKWADKAEALPDSAGCAACHRDRAATDHVFTQFYSLLKSTSELL